MLGQFEGSIKSKGKIYVAEGSSCKAMVSAKEVSIEGDVEGNVEADDRVEIRPTGQIVGDIVAARMTMADGATINGHCRIGINGKADKGRDKTTVEVKPTAARAQAQTVKAG